MANLENEIKVLKENNNELVQKVQYWKMTAAQREHENIELMKEVTDLRLKLSRLRNGGDMQAHKLDAALQVASEEVLSHLVQASNAVARSMELVKTYMHERQELESALPRWSTISDGNSTKKINKVRPMLIGGRTVQPFVLLDRTIDVGNHTAEASQSQSHNVSQRAIPMHMLLDVYIPLRRIDAQNVPANNEDNNEDVEPGDEVEEGLDLEDGDTQDESHNMTPDDGFEESRRLDVVSEEAETGEEQTPQRAQAENPLEGPSWLLDRPQFQDTPNTPTEADSTTGAGEPGPTRTANKMNSQHNRSDIAAAQASFSEPGQSEPRAPEPLNPPGPTLPPGLAPSPGRDSVFSPTVRRRRCATPPPPATPRQDNHSRQPARRYSNSGRILKVLVPKLRFEDSRDSGSPRDLTSCSPRGLTSGSPRGLAVGSPLGLSSPVALRALALQAAPSPTLPLRPRDHKRRLQESVPAESPASRPVMRFDAPSPNGATDARVIVMETNANEPEPCSSGVRARAKRSRQDSHESGASDGRTSRRTEDSDSEGEMLADRRPRRQKKTVVYKEKPLNRKMRR